MAFASSLLDFLGPREDRFTVYTPARRLREAITGKKNQVGKFELGDLLELGLDPFLLAGVIGGAGAKALPMAARKANQMMGRGARTMPFVARELAERPGVVGRVFGESPVGADDLARLAAQRTPAEVTQAKVAAELAGGAGASRDTWQMPQALLHQGIKDTNIGGYRMGPGVMTTFDEPVHSAPFAAMTDYSQDPTSIGQRLMAFYRNKIQAHPTLLDRAKVRHQGGTPEYLSTALQEQLMDIRTPEGKQLLKDIQARAGERAMADETMGTQWAGSAPKQDVFESSVKDWRGGGKPKSQRTAGEWYPEQAATKYREVGAEPLQRVPAYQPEAQGVPTVRTGRVAVDTPGNMRTDMRRMFGATSNAPHYERLITMLRDTENVGPGDLAEWLNKNAIVKTNLQTKGIGLRDVLAVADAEIPAERLYGSLKVANQKGATVSPTVTTLSQQLQSTQATLEKAIAAAEKAGNFEQAAAKRLVRARARVEAIEQARRSVLARGYGPWNAAGVPGSLQQIAGDPDIGVQALDQARRAVRRLEGRTSKYGQALSKAQGSKASATKRADALQRKLQSAKTVRAEVKAAGSPATDVQSESFVTAKATPTADQWRSLEGDVRARYVHQVLEDKQKGLAGRAPGAETMPPEQADAINAVLKSRVTPHITFDPTDPTAMRKIDRLAATTREAMEEGQALYKAKKMGISQRAPKRAKYRGGKGKGMPTLKKLFKLADPEHQRGLLGIKKIADEQFNGDFYRAVEYVRLGASATPEARKGVKFVDDMLEGMGMDVPMFDATIDRYLQDKFAFAKRLSVEEQQQLVAMIDKESDAAAAVVKTMLADARAPSMTGKGAAPKTLRLQGARRKGHTGLNKHAAIEAIVANRQDVADTLEGILKANMGEGKGQDAIARARAQYAALEGKYFQEALQEAGYTGIRSGQRAWFPQGASLTAPNVGLAEELSFARPLGRGMQAAALPMGGISQTQRNMRRRQQL